MMRIVILALLATSALSPAVYPGQLVEVVLVDKLDDERGYCIDMRGAKERADPASGLQAHTCYSYQVGLL